MNRPEPDDSRKQTAEKDLLHRAGQRWPTGSPGLFRKPAQADAAQQLARLAGESGIALIEMTIAFVLRHPR
jgi:hypothetical protein